MSHADPLDGALANLRQALADTHVIVGSVADLRTNAERLLPLVAVHLRTVRVAIDHTLSLLEEGAR